MDNATGLEDSNCTEGRGYCRADGVCDCFAGYSGALCQIQACPMDASGRHCSGNGYCLNDTVGSGELSVFFWCMRRLVPPSQCVSCLVCRQMRVHAGLHWPCLRDSHVPQ